MPKRSLFAILCDLPWWISLLVAALVYYLGAFFSPVIGAAAAVPFVGVAAYVAYLRIKRGPQLDVEALLKALRSASAEEMRTMLTEVFGAQRYELGDSPGGDLTLARNGYITLVRYRRWRAQSVNAQALDELRRDMQREKADHAMYVTAGSIQDNVRQRAADASIVLVDGPALAQLVRRTGGARKAMARAAQVAAQT
jgi:hypothetical protein